MRKLFIILLALVLSIIMIVPAALPAAAASPHDDKPVAWVSFGGSNGNTHLEAGYHLQLLVKVEQYADGTTSGFFREKDLLAKTTTENIIVKSNFFAADDAKVADLLASAIDPAGSGEWWMWRQFTDKGEPGYASGDCLMTYFWLPTSQPGVLPPMNSVVWPPAAYGSNGNGIWWPFFPTGPIVFTGGNVQVHLPSD